jgi:lactate dehydrogenase-like 2-hydroxyacid dehydrogenase
MKPVVLVTRKLPEAVEDRLRRNYDPILNPDDTLYSKDEIIARAEGADAIMPCHTEQFDADVIARLPQSVKAIANFSVGYDHVDIEAAKARGLIVTNTPEVLSDATAELTFMLMLGAARRAHEGEWLVRSGEWKDCELEDGAIYHETPEDLMPHCDFLTLHTVASPQTVKLLNADLITLLPDGAIVVNASRGVVIDDDALIAALKSGKLAAAGLDVYNNEPDIHPAYRKLRNVFLMPHIGSATRETRDAMGFRAIDNLDAIFAGKEPQDRVA